MARRHRKVRKPPSLDGGSRTRDALASLQPSRLGAPTWSAYHDRSTRLLEVEDLRRSPYPDTPYAARPAPGLERYRDISGKAARYGYVVPRADVRISRQMRPQMQLEFLAPYRAAVCRRRQVRKAVLHALRKTGKAGQKKARWSAKSYIRCR